ncbi:ABC-three component system middle component 5 [Marinobacter salarius]|uniref:ABC-three component system middle component 5 n=1 Tax=Marinobacter salarius TaxID=1420917 RepID=UPI0032155DE6
MLLYTPAYDPYHCSFRILSILIEIYPAPLEKEKLSILDAYLAIPALLNELKCPQSLIRKRNKVRPKPSPYNQYYDAQKLFEKISRIQDSVLRNLASINLISLEKLHDNIVLLNIEKIEDTLQEAIDSTHSIKPDIFEFLTHDLSTIDLLGPTGLKKRSGLMEYRYDLS